LAIADSDSQLPIALAERTAFSLFLSYTMSQAKCSKCGAELLPDVNFCRQCGAAAANAHSGSSELPTAILEPTGDTASTRQLNSRSTSPEHSFRGGPSIASPPASNRSQTRWLPIVLIATVVVVSMCVLAWAALIRSRSHAAQTIVLAYPGSQTIVDTTTPHGRAVHLQTGDAFDKVVAWYTAQLKPGKTMRVTPELMVLSNGDTTVTIAVDGSQTNILIKQTLQ
jgi:ribosomal protein L40E